VTLHLVPGEVDDLELRVILESLIDGALELGDAIVEAVEQGDTAVAVALTSTFRDARRSIRRLRALMRADHA
jgi:hypothetical protein